MITNWIRERTQPEYRGPLALATVLLAASLVPVGLFAGGGGAPVTTQFLGVGLDKWLHVVGFGALAASLVSAMDKFSWRELASVLIVTVAFGVAIELLQWPLPWRTASLADVLADAVGAIVGSGLAGLIRVYRP